MDSKIVRILTKADQTLPDEGILDSYFNASEERQSKIERCLRDWVVTYNPPNFSTDEESALDYLYSKCDNVNIASMIRVNINNVK